MKKIMILALACMSLQAFAQAPQGNDRPHKDRKDMAMNMRNFSPEQQATLHTKRMALNLDLSDAQQKEIYNLNLNQAKARQAQKEAFKAKKESNEKMSEDDRYNFMIKRLDDQMAYKSKMKSILKSEQYATWEQQMEDKKHQAKRRMKHNKNNKRQFSADDEPHQKRRS